MDINLLTGELEGVSQRCSHFRRRQRPGRCYPQVHDVVALPCGNVDSLVRLLGHPPHTHTADGRTDKCECKRRGTEVNSTCMQHNFAHNEEWRQILEQPAASDRASTNKQTNECFKGVQAES